MHRLQVLRHSGLHIVASSPANCVQAFLQTEHTAATAEIVDCECVFSRGNKQVVRLALAAGGLQSFLAHPQYRVFSLWGLAGQPSESVRVTTDCGRGNIVQVASFSDKIIEAHTWGPFQSVPFCGTSPVYVIEAPERWPSG